jgi:hypothetical protein
VSLPVLGTRYSFDRIGVDGKRDCHRGGSVHCRARGPGRAAGPVDPAAWGIPWAFPPWGKVIDPAGAGGVDGSGLALSSEGEREQAEAAASTRKKRVRPIGRRA